MIGERKNCNVNKYKSCDSYEKVELEEVLDKTLIDLKKLQWQKKIVIYYQTKWLFS